MIFMYDPQDPDNWVEIQPLRAPDLAIVRVIHNDSNKIIADKDLDATPEDAYLSGGEEYTYIASLPSNKNYELKWCFWLDERDNDFEKDYTVKIETIEEEKAEAESNFFLSSQSENDIEKKAENTKLLREHAILSATVTHQTHDIKDGKPREVAVLKVKFSKWLEGENIRVEVYEHNTRKTEPLRDVNNKTVNGLVVAAKELEGIYFYASDGTFLGYKGKSSKPTDKVVIFQMKTDSNQDYRSVSYEEYYKLYEKEKRKENSSAVMLSLTHQEFIERVHWAFGEGGGVAADYYAHAINNKSKKLGEQEMYVHMNAGETGSAQAHKKFHFSNTATRLNYRIFNKYRTSDYKVNIDGTDIKSKWLQGIEKMAIKNTNRSFIESLTNMSYDPTNGADAWTGGKGINNRFIIYARKHNKHRCIFSYGRNIGGYSLYSNILCSRT